jgi:hypothetical protein
MLLTTFDVISNSQCAQITDKIKWSRDFQVYMTISMTQFNLKVSKFRLTSTTCSDKCAQIMPKRKTRGQIRHKKYRVYSIDPHVIERPVCWRSTSLSNHCLIRRTHNNNCCRHVLADIMLKTVVVDCMIL